MSVFGPGTYVRPDGTTYVVPRCESRHSEGKRTWRCNHEVGHKGLHSNYGGGRRWSHA